MSTKVQLNNLIFACRGPDLVPGGGGVKCLCGAVPRIYILLYDVGFWVEQNWKWSLTEFIYMSCTVCFWRIGDYGLLVCTHESAPHSGKRFIKRYIANCWCVCTLHHSTLSLVHSYLIAWTKYCLQWRILCTISIEVMEVSILFYDFYKVFRFSKLKVILLCNTWWLYACKCVLPDKFSISFPIFINVIR
jgi:hypothetical protein